MARFAVASKALRGPFKKLIRKLELNVRRVVIKVRPKAAARYADTSKHADKALKAAREESAALRASGRKLPVATSAAVDRTTGRVVAIGHSGHDTPVPAELMSRLPDPSLEKLWVVTNCGEVEAASKALEAGYKFEDLVIRTVRTRVDELFPPCENCKQWVPGKD